jgi:hypothetical protein
VQLWAVVDTGGTLARSSAGVTSSRVTIGEYRVDFNTDVSQCAFIPQIGGIATSAPTVGMVHAFGRSGFNDEVVVQTYDGNQSSGADLEDRSFHIAVYC